MISEHEKVEPIDEADSEVVVDQYGELGSVYAETRSAVARSLGRKRSAREWDEVEAEIEAGRSDQA